jgi:hypothetical protein
MHSFKFNLLQVLSLKIKLLPYILGVAAKLVYCHVRGVGAF